jgi:hypothetical protein
MERIRVYQDWPGKAPRSLATVLGEDNARRWAQGEASRLTKRQRREGVQVKTMREAEYIAKWGA